MLGLVLVVGLMALLLAGTLVGLWSYYVTVNVVRAKLEQQRGAEEIKTLIAKLVEPQSLAEQRQYPNKDKKLRDVKDALEEFGKKYVPADDVSGGDTAETSDERGWLNAVARTWRSSRTRWMKRRERSSMAATTARRGLLLWAWLVCLLTSSCRERHES